MAANETLQTLGAWATLIASDVVADGGVNDSAQTALDAAFSTGNEADWPLMDLKLDITSGTPATAGAAIDVYLTGQADTDAEPGADATDLGHSHYLGSFVLHDTATSHYYLYQLPILDREGKIFTHNDSGGSLTYTVTGRARGYKASAS